VGKNSRFGSKSKEDFGPDPFELLPKSLEREVIQVLQQIGSAVLQCCSRSGNVKTQISNAKKTNNESSGTSTKLTDTRINAKCQSSNDKVQMQKSLGERKNEL
jgi:hypothetical protein